MGSSQHHNYLFWRGYVTEVFCDEMAFLSKFYKEGLLPLFANLESEAQAMTNEAWERFMGMPGGEGASEPSEYAERAEWEGIDWYISMQDLHYGLNELMCVAIWSRMERFLKFLLERELYPFGKPAVGGLHRFTVLCEEYSKCGINLCDLQAFSMVDVVRLINNVHKHGRGPAFDELRKKRPDLVSSGPGGKIKIRLEASGGELMTISDDFVSEALEAASRFAVQVVECLKDDS